MIAMQMRAKRRVNALRRVTGCRKPLEPRKVQLMDRLDVRALAAIASAGIDDDDKPVHIDNPGLPVELEHIVRGVGKQGYSQSR